MGKQNLGCQIMNPCERPYCPSACHGHIKISLNDIDSELKFGKVVSLGACEMHLT